MMATLQPSRLQMKHRSCSRPSGPSPRVLVVQAACNPWGSPARPALGSSAASCRINLLSRACKSASRQRRGHQSRALTVTTKAMVNVDFASPSLVLGAVLIGCGVLLLQMRNLQTRVSRDADIVVAAMVSIVGSTLIFQGWRLDPLLLLCQALTTSVAVWYGIETFRLRSKEEEEQETAERMLPPPQQQAGMNPNWMPPPGAVQQQPYQQQPGGPIQDLMQAFMSPQQAPQQGGARGQQPGQPPLGDYSPYQQQQGMYLPPAQESPYPWVANNPNAMYTPQDMLYDQSQQQQQGWTGQQQGYMQPTQPDAFYGTSDAGSYYPPQEPAGYAAPPPGQYGYTGQDVYQQPAQAAGFSPDSQGRPAGYAVAGEPVGGGVQGRPGDARVAAGAVAGQRVVEQIDDWE